MSGRLDSVGIEHRDGTALRLYTYLPEDNTVLTDGLLSTALAPSGFEKYRGRTGKHSKADVLRVLDSWEPEWTRSKALSALTEPIPPDAGSDFAEFARGHRLYSFDLKDLVRAKLLAHLRRARKGGGTDPVDTVRKERPNWHRKRKHFLFQGVPHYFVETTGGRVPPEFVREEKKATRVSDRLAKSAEVKTAASKLRMLLNAGKLRPGLVSMLRRVGMLPSRQQYVDGARKMLKNRLEKIFAHASEREIPLTVRTGVPRVESSHVFSSPVDNVHKVMTSVGQPIRQGAVNAVWGRPVDPLGAEHTINIPGAVGIVQSSTNPARIAVDTTKASLHDILTANHELDEYLGWWRHGGISAWHNPMAVLADLRTHMPGVLRRERVLYERLCNQLGVRSPRWSDFKSGGLTGSVPSRRSELASEQIQSTLTDRDHASLLRLLSSVPATEKEIAVATGAVSGNLFRPMWDAARSYTARAADLAARRGMRKLERYLKSNPVAYYLPGRKRAIASPNYHHVLRNQEHNSPEVSRVSAKELMDFYMGR